MKIFRGIRRKKAQKNAKERRASILFLCLPITNEATPQTDEMYSVVANRHEREPGFEKPVCEALCAGRPVDGRGASPITLPTGKPFATVPAAGSPSDRKFIRNVGNRPVG